MKLNYTYKHPFNVMTQAYLKKYIWEFRTQLTTVAGFEQTSDDEISYIRRCERLTNDQLGYERVTINRRDKTMITQALQNNTDGSEGHLETHIFKSVGEATHDELSVFATGSKNLKVEQYRNGIAATLRAIKFAQFEEEDA